MIGSDLISNHKVRNCYGIMINNKEKYKNLCDKEGTLPIFSKYWWLDAVCGANNWDVALVERNNEIVASMPYYLTNRFGMTLIKMPKLTQTMGPWIKYPEGQKYASKLSYEKEIFYELIENLPTFTSFNQNFHYSITNWLPFYWKGFQQTTKYTYVIEDLSDLDKVYLNFKKQLRKEIRKIECCINVSFEDDIEKFFEINKLTYERQNKPIPYSLDFIKRIDSLCRELNCRKIFFAIDQNNNIHSALYLIWDANSAYDLMGGTDPKHKSSNAKSLITWEAIKYAAQVTKSFDFEGSMMQNVEQFNRGFGAVQKQYFNISKVSSKLMRVKKALSQIAK